MRRAALLLCLGLSASAQEPADEVLKTLPPGGVAVQLGWHDGSPAERLAERGTWIVHLLVGDEAKASAARRHLESRGLYGRAAVEVWTAASLPFPDHLANVLVARETEIPEAELRRIVAPGGTLWTPRGAERKPRPREHDAWTHWRHGADGNMVSRDQAVAAPTGLRWVAGPAQDAGGKKWYYDHVLVTAQGRNVYVYEDGLIARDAYNGTLLWMRPLKAHTFKETGTTTPSEKNPQNKIGTRVTKVRPVVVGDTLFATSEGRVLAIDAATGRDAGEFGAVTNPRELLVEDGVLVVADGESIRGFDPAGRKPLWKAAVGARRIVAGDGAVFAVTGTEAVALDLKTGDERWRSHDSDVAQVLTATYGQGVLVLEKATLRDDTPGCGLLAFSAKDGRTLWKKDVAPRMTHYQEARSFFTQGLLWINAVEKKGPQLLGLDPQTGEPRKHWWGAGGAHCAPPLATERYFIAPECNFTDLRTGEKSVARMVKSACRLPFVPANGLLYTFPIQCECFPMLRGYMALVSGAPPGIDAAPLLRPAGRRAPAEAGTPPPVDEWPTYRHDVYRSGSTPCRLEAARLRPLWEAAVVAPAEGPLAADWKANPFVRGPLTPPVAAGGRVVVAAPDVHRVAAFDAATGALRWTFTAGGRVDTPPTLDRGRCYFGAHDGSVYCLDADDGTLVWRHRIAPRDARIPAYGQMESPWPAPGSVLVDGGIAYAAAGRHPMSDGGVTVAALRADTGELVWRRVLTEVPISKWYGPKLATNLKVGLDFEPVDLLVRDGAKVAMSRWQFDPATGDVELELGNVEYAAFGGMKVPRGLWGYGIRQTKQVDAKAPAVFDGKGLFKGAKGDVALLLAGGLKLSATQQGELLVGDRVIHLGAPPVHDGLIAAYGRLYVSTQKGTLLCLE
jgi:outer membrane protein assembly factor BamB